MKGYNLLILLTVLFLSDFALAQIPSCPCDTLALSNGLTGNEIIENICPGGEISNEAVSEVNEFFVLIESLFEGGGYFAGNNPDPVCAIGAVGLDAVELALTPVEVEECRARLITACGLDTRPIPTLSQWGLIAMAGILGIIALIAARRRKSVTNS